MRRRKNCLQCGAPFVGNHWAVYCNDACASVARSAEIAARSGASLPVARIPRVDGAEAHRRASARWAVRYALQKGILSRGRCEQDGRFCSGPVEAHHGDYDKPLEVRWLCRGHHRQVDGWKMRRFQKVQPKCNIHQKGRGLSLVRDPGTLVRAG